MSMHRILFCTSAIVYPTGAFFSLPARAGSISAVLLILIGSLFCATPAALGAEPIKILLVSTKLDHPPASHMYAFECDLLGKCLTQTPGVEIVRAEDWPKDEKTLEGVKAIVYYSRPAGDIVLSPQHRESFKRLMDAGVGYTAIHWATDAGKPFGQEYLGILGGWFHVDHCGLKVDTRPLVQIDPAHPICRGWKSYPLREEFYLNLKFHPEAKPILKANVDGKDQTVAWAFERKGPKGGRSFGTTLGHFHDNFTIPEFRKALVNGILWSAGVDVGDEGAKVLLTAEQTQLPK